MKKVQLFGDSLQAISPTVSSQMRINCFYEIKKDGDKSNFIIRGTPGLSLASQTLNTFAVRGVFSTMGFMYIVAGNVLYKMGTNNVMTSIGLVSSGTQIVGMSSNGVQLIIADGIAGWTYTYATNTLTQIAFGLVLGVIVAGTLYTAGTYTNVTLTGGTGSGANATVVVSNGGVTSVTPTAYGIGYLINDVLSANVSTIGGTGSGFTVMVSQSNSGFPNGTNSVCFIDGYFVVNSPNSQQFYISNLLDGTNWQPLQFASKESSPDLLIAVSNLNSTVLLWGTNSIEFWQDAGTFPFPLQRISGSTSSWGLAAQSSIASIGNTLMFLGQNSQGLVQIMILNGFTPQRVSTHDIENIITSFSTVIDAIALTYMIDGHIMYQITFPTANQSFLYDVTTDLWSIVRNGISANRHLGQMSVVFNNQNYVSDYSNGNLYTFNKTSYTDNGTVILREVDTRHVTEEGNVFTLAELLLDMDTGETTLESGQGSNPTIMLQTSKDYGRTFGNVRTVSLGATGQYRSPRVVFRRFGSARDFVFKITMTDPVPFIIIGASATIEQSPSQ